MFTADGPSQALNLRVWESPYRVVKVTCESLWVVRSRWDQVGPGGSRWVRVGMVGKPSGEGAQDKTTCWEKDIVYFIHH